MKTIAQQLNVKDFPYIITDKDGNQTYFEDTYGFWNKREYDKNGKETYFENTTGYWSKRKFNKNGKEIYHENSTSGVITDDRPKTNSEFLPNPFASKTIMKTIAQQLNVTDFPFIIKDNNGKETYYEDSKGYWLKREHDKNGERTYYEDSTGHWVKRKFDKNGKQTYYEDSYGYCYKREFDSNGKETYHENPDGKVIDNRPKVTFTIKEIAEKLGVAVESLRIKE